LCIDVEHKKKEARAVFFQTFFLSMSHIPSHITHHRRDGRYDEHQENKEVEAWHRSQPLIEPSWLFRAYDGSSGSDIILLADQTEAQAGFEQD